MSNWIALFSAISALIVSFTGLLALLKGQQQTHEKLDAVNAQVATPGVEETVGELIERVANGKSTPVEASVPEVDQGANQ